MAVSSRRQSAAFRRGFIALAVASTCVLVIASSAQAATVTVGSPLIGSFKQEGPTSITGTLSTIALGESGAHATSPVNGIIVRWHLLEAEGGPFTFRVLRQTGGPAYTAIGSSAPVTASGIKFETFTTAMPIRAGDTIGLDIPEGVKLGADTAAPPASVIAIWKPALAEGATLPYSEGAGSGEWGFNAEVQPTPSVASVAPASGPIKGGTSVTISGEDFAGVSGVSFGGVPATSFTVGSESSITAVTPANAKAGGVDVTVTTVAGTTPLVAADQFAYTACIVPKLKGKKLKAARKALTKADCKLGKVTGKKSKSAKVKKQSAQPGKVLPPGAKVNVKLAS